MPLTKEQRQDNMAKARAAKAGKQPEMVKSETDLYNSPRLSKNYKCPYCGGFIRRTFDINPENDSWECLSVDCKGYGMRGVTDGDEPVPMEDESSQSPNAYAGIRGDMEPDAPVLGDGGYPGENSGDWQDDESFKTSTWHAIYDDKPAPTDTAMQEAGAALMGAIDASVERTAEMLRNGPFTPAWAMKAEADHVYQWTIQGPGQWVQVLTAPATCDTVETAREWVLAANELEPTHAHWVKTTAPDMVRDTTAITLTHAMALADNAKLSAEIAQWSQAKVKFDIEGIDVNNPTAWFDKKWEELSAQSVALIQHAAIQRKEAADAIRANVSAALALAERFDPSPAPVAGPDYSALIVLAPEGMTPVEAKAQYPEIAAATIRARPVVEATDAHRKAARDIRIKLGDVMRGNMNQIEARYWRDVLAMYDAQVPL